MRILYHHRTLGDGAEGIHVTAMVEAFRRNGHDVRVVSLIGEQTNVQTARTRRLALLTRWTPRAAYEAMELGYGAYAYRALTREIARWRPDVIYERYTLFNWGGVTAARRAGVPIVLEVNAPLAYERARYEALAMRKTAQRFERMICGAASLVEVVSTPLADHLTRLGVDPGQIVVVPNGADPAIFRPDEHARRAARGRLGIPDDRVVVGFSGIMRPWHGTDLLMEAAIRGNMRDRVHLLFVGDGPSRAELEAQAARCGMRDRLTITGRIPHAEIPAYLSAFDIGVSPRTTFYASPMKVPEYMATGIAVVAPRAANLEDLIRDGEDGMLFAPERPDDLAAVLDRLVADPALRTRLGAAARRTIETSRTWQHNAAKVLDTLYELGGLQRCA